MKSLQYYYRLGGKLSTTANVYNEHFLKSLASIRYLKKIKIPSLENVLKSRMQLAKLDDELESSRIH